MLTQQPYKMTYEEKLALVFMGLLVAGSILLGLGLAFTHGLALEI